MDTLLNWIWQGCVIAVATAALLRLMHSWSASVRYRAVGAALASILLLPVVPFLWVSAPPMPALASAAPSSDPLVAIPPAWWTSTAAIAALWASWSVIQIWRLTIGALALRRARLDCRRPPEGLDARLPRWSMVKEGGRITRLALSRDVRAAAVLGGHGPVIAISPVLLEHLSDDEIDRVVMHEWAHVQRRDDLAYALQLLVRVVAGWHPAVWWCNRQLQIERELACDEMAVAMTGSVKAYATCLTKLAALPRTTALPLPVVSVLSSGLRGRIVRILSLDRVMMTRPRTGMAIAAAVALALTTFLVGGFQAIGAAPVRAAGPQDVVRDRPVAEAAEPVTPAPVSSSTQEATAANAGPRDQGGPDESRPRRRARRTDIDRAQSSMPAPRAIDTPSLPATNDTAVPLASRTLTVPAPGAWSAPDAARMVTPAANAQPTSAPAEAQPVGPWSAAAATAAGTGVAIGRGSQNAAETTAGFFSRLGRRIGGAF